MIHFSGRTPAATLAHGYAVTCALPGSSLICALCQPVHSRGVPDIVDLRDNDQSYRFTCSERHPHNLHGSALLDGMWCVSILRESNLALGRNSVRSL